MPVIPISHNHTPQTPQLMATDGRLIDIAIQWADSEDAGQQARLLEILHNGIARSAQDGRGVSLARLWKMEGLPTDTQSWLEQNTQEFIDICRENGWATSLAQLLDAEALPKHVLEPANDALKQMINRFANEGHPTALLNLIQEHEIRLAIRQHAHEALVELASTWSAEGHPEKLYWLYTQPETPDTLRPMLEKQLEESIRVVVQMGEPALLEKLLLAEHLPRRVKATITDDFAAALHSALDQNRVVPLLESAKYVDLPITYQLQIQSTVFRMLWRLTDRGRPDFVELFCQTIGLPSDIHSEAERLLPVALLNAIRHDQLRAMLWLHKEYPSKRLTQLIEEGDLDRAQVRALARCVNNKHIMPILALLEHPGPKQVVKELAILALERDVLPQAIAQKEWVLLAKIEQARYLPAQLRADAGKALLEIFEDSFWKSDMLALAREQPSQAVLAWLIPRITDQIKKMSRLGSHAELVHMADDETLPQTVRDAAEQSLLKIVIRYMNYNQVDRLVRLRDGLPTTRLQWLDEQLENKFAQDLQERPLHELLFWHGCPGMPNGVSAQIEQAAGQLMEDGLSFNLFRPMTSLLEYPHLCEGLHNIMAKKLFTGDGRLHSALRPFEDRSDELELVLAIYKQSWTPASVREDIGMQLTQKARSWILEGQNHRVERLLGQLHFPKEIKQTIHAAMITLDGPATQPILAPSSDGILLAGFPSRVRGGATGPAQTVIPPAANQNGAAGTSSFRVNYRT